MKVRGSNFPSLGAAQGSIKLIYHYQNVMLTGHFHSCETLTYFFMPVKVESTQDKFHILCDLFYNLRIVIDLNLHRKGVQQFLISVERKADLNSHILQCSI